jgi:hypothetical protein
MHHYKPNECHVAITLAASLVPHRNKPFGISKSVTAKRRKAVDIVF